MESNSLLLGRIPGSGSGLRKTYEESIFLKVNEETMESILTNNRIFYNYNTRTSCNNPNGDSNFKEMAIIGINQFFHFSMRYEKLVPYNVIEIIDKNILHRHLLEEKIMLENLNQESAKLGLEYGK